MTATRWIARTAIVAVAVAIAMGAMGRRAVGIDTPGPVFAQVYAVGTQTIPHNVNTAMAFTTVESDVFGYWNAAQPTRLTVPPGHGGLFVVQAGSFTWLNPAQDCIVYIEINGDPRGALGSTRSYPQTGANNNPIGYIATNPVPVLLDDGDYIEFIVYVDSPTGDKTFGTPSGSSPSWMALTRQRDG